jgi:hypothetical protein
MDGLRLPLRFFFTHVRVPMCALLRQGKSLATAAACPHPVSDAPDPVPGAEKRFGNNGPLSLHPGHAFVPLADAIMCTHRCGSTQDPAVSVRHVLAQQNGRSLTLPQMACPSSPLPR